LKSIIWRKSWNVFIKNLNFFSTEERMTWTSWETWGRVNYQQKFFSKVNYSFNTPTCKCANLNVYFSKYVIYLSFLICVGTMFALLDIKMHVAAAGRKQAGLGKQTWLW